MAKTAEENYNRALAELRRVTGLDFTLETPPETEVEACTEKIASLTAAWREMGSRTGFLRRLLTGDIREEMLYESASRLRIPVEEERLLFLVEADPADLEEVLAILRQIFITSSHDIVFRADERRAAFLKAIGSEEEEDLLQIARTIVDMANTEAMVRVRVGYGHAFRWLADMAEAYREGLYALTVGRIFMTHENVIRITSLGIGRLVYDLPEETARQFMLETFGEAGMPAFDDETQETIETFYDNNLNISETARQLFLHRNTLVYRLEKIRQATGLDIRLFDDAMTFQLAHMIRNCLRERDAGRI